MRRFRSIAAAAAAAAAAIDRKRLESAPL